MSSSITSTLVRGSVKSSRNPSLHRKALGIRWNHVHLQKPSHIYHHLSSSAPYASTSTSSSPKSPNIDITAATCTPSLDQLSPSNRIKLDRMIRVDQAGELGANWIYRGQKWGMGIRGDKKTEQQIEEMWSTERHHLRVLTSLQKQHLVRPTALYPLWQGMAFGLGAFTALLGKEVAMACTEAVETVIGEHYDDQLKTLKPILSQSNSPLHPSLHLLSSILEEFRDDELEHLDTAVEEGAQKAPGHSLISAVIGVGCKGAIWVSERV